MTNEQAVAFMNAISCKTLLVTGSKYCKVFTLPCDLPHHIATGWPLGTAGDVDARKKPLEDKVRILFNQMKPFFMLNLGTSHPY